MRGVLLSARQSAQSRKRPCGFRNGGFSRPLLSLYNRKNGQIAQGLSQKSRSGRTKKRLLCIKCRKLPEICSYSAKNGGRIYKNKTKKQPKNSRKDGHSCGLFTNTIKFSENSRKNGKIIMKCRKQNNKNEKKVLTRGNFLYIINLSLNLCAALIII